MENQTRPPFDNAGDMRNVLNRLETITEAAGKVSARQAIILAFSNMDDPHGEYQAGPLVNKLEELGVVWSEFKTGTDVHGKAKGKGDLVRRFRCNMLANQGTVVIKQATPGYFTLVPDLIQEPGVPAPSPESIPGQDPEPVLNKAMDAVDATQPQAAKVVKTKEGKTALKTTGAKKTGKRKDTLTVKQKAPAAAPKPPADPNSKEVALNSIVVYNGEEETEYPMEFDMKDRGELKHIAGQVVDLFNAGAAPELVSVQFFVNKSGINSGISGENLSGSTPDEIEAELMQDYMTAMEKKAATGESAANFADFVMEFHDETGEFQTDLFDLGVDSVDQDALNAVNVALADYVRTQ